MYAHERSGTAGTHGRGREAPRPDLFRVHGGAAHRAGVRPGACRLPSTRPSRSHGRMSHAINREAVVSDHVASAVEEHAVADSDRSEEVTREIARETHAATDLYACLGANL